MESKTPTNGVPTALPGFEDDDAREKFLLETTGTESDIESDDDEADLLEEKRKPKKRRWQVMRTLLGFGIFVGILALAVSWFFRLGWFAESKAQPISRNISKDAPTSPVTGDEKLKMALSMVAANESKTSGTSASRIDPEETSSTAGTSAHGTGPVGDIHVDSGIPSKAEPTAIEPPFALVPSANTPAQKESSSDSSGPIAAGKENPATTASRTDASGEPPGRSLFFGVARKPLGRSVPESRSETSGLPTFQKDVVQKGIPFGTLLPVRLVGSVYTFRNSGGFVRMELTRPVEGKGYSYPAGTTVVGNVRGGESDRAFVTIIGLIEPVSGELVKFGGELLGRDGSSGIEGRRRKLTSQWARFFNGLKETASSVLGSVGAIRSGGTVILSEPIRRGSESISEDFSDAILRNGKDNTFIEVSAGANGYVLVTNLPDGSTVLTGNLKAEAGDK
jgi:cytoskeletal protein RodZ